MLGPEVIAILDMDYPRSKTIRADAIPFLHLNRDSRLRAGLFRTEDEHAAWIAKGLAIQLPTSHRKSKLARKIA